MDTNTPTPHPSKLDICFLDTKLMIRPLTVLIPNHELNISKKQKWIIYMYMYCLKSKL